MSSLSIILPTFNEVKSIGHVLNVWHNYLEKLKIKHEFVICEDGSTDGTKELILKLTKKFPIVNESSINRRGYGGGVLAGIQACHYDYLLCIDSDGQCMPDSFSLFWENRASEDILIGIRSQRMDPFLRKIYSFLFFVLHKILFPSAIRDPSCPYILAKKQTYFKLVPLLSFMREGFWWGFIGAALKLKINIKQYHIRHYARYDGSSVVYRFHKMPSIICRNIVGLVKLRLRQT
jgi:glycosyltransferase involved in cell wall biosynthesis